MVSSRSLQPTSQPLRLGCCCLLVVLLVGTVAPSIAAPPPRPLCDACGESFEETAETYGVAVTVERSTATVSVGENGSATWVVQNQLADSEGVERLRSNASLRTRIADRAMWDTQLLGANVSSDGVLTMRYREPDFAHPSVGGTLYSGEFTEAYGYRNLDGLGADRLVVVAPEGKQIGWTVADGTRSEDGRRMAVTRLGGGGLVTFEPDDALLGPLWSLLAVASLVAPAVVTNALVGVVLPTATFALLLGVGAVLLRVGAGGFSSFDPIIERVWEDPDSALAVSTVLVAVALVAGGGLSLLGGIAAPLFGVGITLAFFAVAFSRSGVRRRATYRTLVVGAGVGALVAAGSTVAGAVAFDQNGLTYSLLSSLPFLVPIFALLPAGYAFARGNRLLAIGTAAIGFALVMTLQGAYFAPTGGVRPFFVILALLYGVGISVVGTPLLVVGASLAGEHSEAE